MAGVGYTVWDILSVETFYNQNISLANGCKASYTSQLSILSPTWYLVMLVYLAFTIHMGAENCPLNVSSRVTDKYRKRIVSISVLHVYGHKELLCCFTRSVITLYSYRREDAILARYGIPHYHSISL